MSEIFDAFTAPAAPALTRRGRKLRITLPLDAWDVIVLTWRSGRALPAADAMRETLTFDLGSGRTYLRLEGPDGAACDVCDLGGRLPAADPLLESFGHFPVLREQLAAAFAEGLGSPLPYTAAELTAERCAALCAYRGYDRAFYDAVPVRSGGCAVPREFRRTARALRRAENLPAAVADCGLPRQKSIRRALFTRPALLFYGAELRTLHDAMPDPNCFCALLAEDHVFALLSALHSYPAAADFYIDLGRALGGPVLLRLLRESRCNLGMSALAYAAMDARGRRQARRAWAGTYEKLSERCMPYHAEDELGYSVPVPQSASPVVPPISAAGDYSFHRLGSSREFSQAGAALQNCLAELSCFFAGDTVLAVCRDGATVAAVQLHGRRVVQALAARNRPIDPDSPLGRSLRNWTARYGLEPAEEEDDL